MGLRRSSYYALDKVQVISAAVVPLAEQKHPNDGKVKVVFICPKCKEQVNSLAVFEKFFG